MLLAGTTEASPLKRRVDLTEVELSGDNCICSFLARTVLSVFTNLSPIFLFFFFSFFFLFLKVFLPHIFLYGLLETRHVDCALRHVPLEHGILVIEVTVGLHPVSANTSLWLGLQLTERSARPSLINRMVALLTVVGVFHQGQSGGGGVKPPSMLCS